MTQHTFACTLAISRRSLLLAGLTTALGSQNAFAAPFDPLARGAKVLKQGSMVIPGRSSSGPGLSGMDVYSPARAWLYVDFSVEQKAELTLMILTQQQKAQTARGQQFSGDPLARLDIEGPETASHSVTVGQGNFFLGFLNEDAKPVALNFRVSLKAF